MKTNELSKQIKSLIPTSPMESSRLPSRLQHAIDRLRWHICGIFGVKAMDVRDKHVAEFLGRIEDEYLYRVLPGIGSLTIDDMRAWGRAEKEKMKSL